MEKMIDQVKFCLFKGIKSDIAYLESVLRTQWKHDYDDLIADTEKAINWYKENADTKYNDYKNLEAGLNEVKTQLSFIDKKLNFHRENDHVTVILNPDILEAYDSVIHYHGKIDSFNINEIRIELEGTNHIKFLPLENVQSVVLRDKTLA